MIAQLPLFELAHVTGGIQLTLDDVRPELVIVIPCSGEKAPGIFTAAGHREAVANLSATRDRLAAVNEAIEALP